jgi:hypothetical protein
MSLAPTAASAVFEFDPGNTIATSLKLPTKDAQSTVISVIQYILTFLDLVAVFLILFGGFRYLTSGGNEETIKSAREILKAAVIGLALILLSQAIMIGVISTITAAQQ